MAKKNKRKTSIKQIGQNFLKSRTLFVILALTFLSILSFVVISNLVFLGKELSNALNINPSSDSTMKFNIEGFKELKLIR